MVFLAAAWLGEGAPDIRELCFYDATFLLDIKHYILGINTIIRLQK